MRAFTAADPVQADSGTSVFTTTATVTVPAGTTEGHGGLIVLGVQNPIIPPAQWDTLAVAGVAQTLAIMCRADLPAGESSWGFQTLTGSANWTWTVGEWANLAWVPEETSASANGTTGDTSIASGSTGVFAAQFVVGIVAVQIMSTGGSAWPTISYSGGFVETDALSVGTGTANGDIYLSVARRYGTDSEAGPWSCTATFTGSMTSKTPNIALAVLRAEDQVLVSAPTMVVS